jgi:putative ABC transport system ATP-binding protein
MLEVVRLGRRTLSGSWLLRGASLAVEAGERVGVTGPSGSGKSVLLRAAALLDRADEGAIRFRGARVAGAGVPAFRRDVVYVPQRPVLVADATTRANLRLPFRFAVNRGRAFDEERIVGWLAAFGRGKDLLDRSARHLSGGESQIIALVRALQLDPAVLLLDEPSASLDAAAASQLEDLVAAWLGGDARRALVWVSHDEAQLERVARRRIVVRGGGIARG